MNKNLIITVLVAVVAAGAGFFGGTKYTESKRTALRGQFGNGQVRGQFTGRSLPAGRQGFRPVAGEVLSVDDKSMTVKLSDGSSKIVIMSQTTTFAKSDAGSLSDVKVGDKVGVFGTDNSDGSVTAQSVQLNFQFNYK